MRASGSITLGSYTTKAVSTVWSASNWMSARVTPGRSYRLLAHLGDTGDSTHHPGDGEFCDGFLHLAGPVDVADFDVAGLATGRAKARRAPLRWSGNANRKRGETFIITNEIRAAKYRRRPDTGRRGLLTSTMTSANDRPTPMHYVLLLLLAATWGSSFILMKVGLFGWRGGPGSPPVLSGVQLGLLRMAFAGTVCRPIRLDAHPQVGPVDLGRAGDQRVHWEPPPGHAVCLGPNPIAQCNGRHAQCSESAVDVGDCRLGSTTWRCGGNRWAACCWGSVVPWG